MACAGGVMGYTIYIKGLTKTNVLIGISVAAVSGRKTTK